MNESIRRKISYRLRGRPKSATTRKRISQALKGKHKTNAHKQAIAEAMIDYWKNKNILLIINSYEYTYRQIENLLHINRAIITTRPNE